MGWGWSEESGCQHAQNLRVALKETPETCEEYGTAEQDLRSPKGRLGAGPCALTHREHQQTGKHPVAPQLP